jgi:uncharacterized circularly permuted ATP-grasp superfamily protein/uncharacterized alpha-E superfamily protein
MDNSKLLAPKVRAGLGKQGALPGALSLGYPLLAGRWDEMFLPDGTPRAYWDDFIERFAALPDSEMERRWERALKLISDNGVTYNVYGDPRGLDRPWRLDPVPLLLPTDEWRAIERALIQRATLINKVLADLYGPRTLLAQGLLPPSVVFANPGYLRPLHGVTQNGNVHLHLYAADIARAPDGHWEVISDRCEAPSGIGYAFENRTIVARTLAEALRARPIEPLVPFLHTLRDSLVARSPRDRETPKIVVLTPGPFNETYFEHAYLARHLGFTLVESGDLTVRDGRVFLKTLDGLQAVDVILRRTDGSYCDPVELKSDSALGVAGLVQAVRAGTVVVANALGCGVVEGGALAPFMPGLSRRLLGEDLLMPSVDTWWCGQRKERDYVIANLDRLVVKQAFGGAPTEPQFGDRMSQSERGTLIDRIRHRPTEYIAQEHIRLSSAPVWMNKALEPRQLMLRVFLTAYDDSYAVMPGGLVRVAAERGGVVVSMQQGGGSKDAWVLAEHKETLPAERRIVTPARLVRGARDLPSRVADNLYWFGRYVERAEDTTRTLRAALSRVGDAAGFGAADELPVTLGLLSRFFRVPDHDSPDEHAMAIARMNFDDVHGVGLRATIERLHRMAAMARDRLSLDTWRAVTRLQEQLTMGPGPKFNLEDALVALNNVVLACEALSGLAMENMTRGLGWRFVDIGRRVERAVSMLGLLSGAIHFKGGMSGPVLDVLLEISDSAMTYRSRYLSAPQFAPVLDLLFADESNPRSVAFQLAALDDHMKELARNRGAALMGPEQRLTIWLTGAVRVTDIEHLANPDEDGGRRGLATFLETVRSKVWELSETMTRVYFTHAATRVAQYARETTT